MRLLTDAELDHLYSNNGCIFCNDRRFIEGPCGGASRNLECLTCGARYNVSVDSVFKVGELLNGPKRAYTKVMEVRTMTKPNPRLWIGVRFALLILIFFALMAALLIKRYS